MRRHTSGAILSLKENMDALKEELNSEEKFFESAIRTERFIKQYQKPLIGGVVALLLAAGGVMGYQLYTESKIERSNLAFNVLLLNPIDAQAQETLKNNNPELYDVWRLSRGMAQNDAAILDSLKNSEAFAVSDIAQYESALIKGEIQGVDAYAKKQGALYKDLASLEVAVHAIEQGNIALAHQKIALISEDSPVYQVAQGLSHYGVK